MLSGSNHNLVQIGGLNSAIQTILLDLEASESASAGSNLRGKSVLLVRSTISASFCSMFNITSAGALSTHLFSLERDEWGEQGEHRGRRHQRDRTVNSIALDANSAITGWIAEHILRDF